MIRGKATIRKVQIVLCLMSIVCILSGCADPRPNTEGVAGAGENNNTEHMGTEASYTEEVGASSEEETQTKTMEETSKEESMSGELLKDAEELAENVTDGSSYEVKMDEVTDVLCPLNVSTKRMDVAYGQVSHFTYMSTTCGMERGANILLPAGYDGSAEYPVLYFLHGIFGDENSMVMDGNNKIPEILGNLKADGVIGDVVVVFPNMYASADPELKPGFTAEQVAPYDNFINDLATDLIPYVEANYAVKKDREHRGLIGFSMGGRESLYIGVCRSDLFSCIGAIAPAPGVTPAKDWAMEHVGQLAEEEFVIHEKEYPPTLLMVCCGTKDSVVGKFPLGYHELLTKNGVEHLWYEVPGADHDSNAIKSGLFNYLIRWMAE